MNRLVSLCAAATALAVNLAVAPSASVAAAPPDGYTFAVVFDTHGVNPSLIASLPFDTRKDLAAVAPARTPPEIVKRMNDEINIALKTAEVAGKLASQGIEVRLGTPEAARAFIDNQIDTWAKVVKDNNIKAD